MPDPNFLELQALLIWVDRTSSLCRILRNGAVGNPDIDQRLHWLHVLLRQQSEELGNADEVHEARIEISVAGAGIAAEVPKGINPVGMVKVGIQAEHLTKAGFEVAVEGLRKARALTKPAAPCELRKGRGRSGRTSWDRGVGMGGVEAAGGVSGGASGNGVNREGFGVVHLPCDPTLY